MSSLAEIAENIDGSLLPDNKTHENRIEIKSESSNRLYIVAQSKTSGEWQCSCPGWTHKKAGKERSCKHLNAMLPMLLSVGSAPRKQMTAAKTTVKAPAKPVKVKAVKKTQSAQAAQIALLVQSPVVRVDDAVSTLTNALDEARQLRKQADDIEEKAIKAFKLATA